MKRRILSIPIIVIIVLLTTVSVGTAALLIGGGGNSENVNLSKGLVGWWKMDGDAKDSTPYGNNGTVTGAVLTTDRKGQVNKAYDFDGGASTNISVTDTTGSSLDLTTAVTVSAWVNVQTTGTKGIVSKGGAGGNEPNGPYSLWTIGTTIYWEVGDDVTGPAISSTLTASTWQHWVGTYSNSTLTLYRNGVKVTGPTGVAVSSMVQNNNALLFADSAGTVTNLDAFIDDVRIYNRALSATEVTALYQEYNPGIQVSDLQKGLVGQWKMDGNAKDATPQGNNGTVTGATLTTDRKGQTNKAYHFDNSDGGPTEYVSVGGNSILTRLAGDSLTVAFWIKITSLPSETNETNFRFLQKDADASGGSNGNYILYLNESTLGFGYTNSANNASYGISSTTADISKNAWHFVVLTYTYPTISDATKPKMYVNGTESTMGAWSSTPDGTVRTDNADAFFIGADSYGTTNYLTDNRGLNGDMDDVRIYNRALTATEITALYQEYDPGIQVSDLQKGLIGHWKMDGNTKDSTPYGNNRLFGSGGTITFSGEYVIHTFTSSGTFTANGSGNVEVLVVGGGGGGGTTGGRGGGGGGGGYQYNSSFAVTAQAYTVTVGAGGAKGVYDSSCSQNGQDSAFGSTVTATGGGRGGGTSNIACSINGGNGGSGGGGEGNTFSAGGTGSQGSDGGDGSKTGYGAGGGGGAGGAGADGSGADGGAGGAGTSNSISGTSVCYAGGGGGGFTGSGGSATCGGGAGASAIATAGTANTGGGGGGANTGADGGSGIVIIRYINSNMSTTVNETFTTDRKGQVNKAYNFDGSTTEINAGDSASGSLETSSAMSISAWIKTGTISADKSIVSKHDGTNGFKFYYYSTNYLNLFIGAQNGQISVDLEDNAWHHIVGTWDGTNTRIYVDGVLPAGGTDAPGTTLAANTGSFRIGFLDGGAANEHWQGDIDDVRYYNRVLSAAEVTALYESY